MNLRHEFVDPVTGLVGPRVGLHCSCFATAAAIASVVGTGLSAVSAIGGGYAQQQSLQAQQQAAQTQAQMAKYQAQVARNNATIAEQQAQREVQIGQERAARKSQEGAAKLAAVKAAQAAAGVDVNTGSAVDVQTSERELNKLDTETVLSDATQRAYGYRSQAQNFRSQSDLYTAQGGLYGQQAGRYGALASDAPTAGWLKAGGTILSSASTLPIKWGGGKEKTGSADSYDGGQASYDISGGLV